MENRNGFSSRIGFILAASGSAVGLGNIWRFPYLAANNGGGIFLFIYIILAVTFGFALLITEIAIGRKTGKSTILAYGKLNKNFKPLGYLASAVPIIIFPYYCVIGGWVLKYMSIYISGNAPVTANSDIYFESFISSTAEPILFLSIFIFITSAIVLLGVEKGIEKASKILMPILVLMTIVISGYCLTLDGALDGFLYYVKPDFSEFSLNTVVAATGQLFYSMSISMGIMITFGSYMRKEDNIESSVRYIEVFDTGVAFLSGMMIVPAVFAFSGGDKSALDVGPGLMFVTLPKVFDTMPGGQIIGMLFFILVLLAALTSAISLMEAVVSIFSDKLKLRRSNICLIVMTLSFLIALPSTLGFGIWSNVKILGMQFLDFFDFISNNVMMPITAFVTCILIGFVVKPKTIIEEVELTQKFRSKKFYIFLIKYVCPICLIIILISSILEAF